MLVYLREAVENVGGLQKITLPELKQALDWYGLNYYTRWMVRSLSSVPALRSLRGHGSVRIAMWVME